MLGVTDSHPRFEALARHFLAEHPEIRHEWRSIKDISGGRTDLVCLGGNAVEVFASLTSYQITVGSGSYDTDFEDFGRGLSDAHLAEEAFLHFVGLLRKRAILVE